MTARASQALRARRPTGERPRRSADARRSCGDDHGRRSATPAQIGAFLAALRVKGETVDEIAGVGAAMRAPAEPVTARAERAASTPAAPAATAAAPSTSPPRPRFVVAGAGVRVAKHGNRAVTSRAAARADVLEALGVNVDARPGASSSAASPTCGIGFMFAPALHPAMQATSRRSRRELGMRTVFNLLGRSTNPAGARHQVIGVYDAALVDRIVAGVARRAGRATAPSWCTATTASTRSPSPA